MSAFQSSMLYSIGLAIAGYVIMLLIGPVSIGPEIIFAAGLLIGAVFIAIVSNSSGSPTEVDTINNVAPKTEDSGAPTKTIYVGNLPYRANEAVIKELFEKFGYVQSVRLLKDRQTGKRRGFGFVEMEEAGVANAIKSLNESEFQQRTLKVREAKERPEKEKEEDDAIQAQH